MRSREKDAQLVVGAGRSLKNMLVDLMSVLENQANTKIFIQGDLTLRVDGRDAYAIKLRNEDNVEPSNLKVRIDSAPVDTPTVASAAVTGNSTEKRKASEVVQVEESSASPMKRARTEEHPPVPGIDEESPNDQDRSDIERIMAKFGNISQQIRWVEDCRRLAGQAHDAREDKWRSTSATFHDDSRKMVERHNVWMTAEMGWQRNMLIQLANDLKGLYPLTHSLKWETPPTINHTAPPIPMPMGPIQHAGNRPLGKEYIPKLKKPLTPAARPGNPSNGART
jgi:hypothetical protein